MILDIGKLCCPYCGGEKEVCFCVSGNGIGATQWSDGKRCGAMLLEVAPIQECQHCKKYYFTEVNADGPRLTFRKSRKAYKQLTEGTIPYQASFKHWMAEAREQKEQKKPLQRKKEKSHHLSEDAMVALLFTVIFAYNDAHGRKGVATDVESKDFAFFRKCVWELLSKYSKSVDRITRAEFFREIGMFDCCVDLLDAMKPKEKFEESCISQIRARALEKKMDVFEFGFDFSSTIFV